MNLISVDGISKLYGERQLFKDASFGIDEGEKVALIGINGCGKSTLLRILIGLEIEDEGSISRNRELKISFLRQIPETDPEDTVLDHIFRGKSERLRIIREYEEIVRRMENENGLEKQFNRIMEEMERLSAWDYESDIKKILQTLKITDLSQKVGELSGGMLKKVSLAQALIEESNLLVLDEPTNHLDMETIIWLQDYLQETKKAVLMVTHDRYFLDAVCDTIYDIENRTVRRYKGNYEFYLARKAEEEQASMAEENRVRTILRRELEWLKRGPKARATKAKARKQNIDSMLNRDRPEEKDELTLGVTGRRLGKKILELENISKGFEGVTLIDGFSYNFKKGDRIGIVGPNGSGKSTLLNIISGRLEPDSGVIDKGVNTHIGYFDQASMKLKGDLRIIDYVKESAEVIKLSDGSVLTASKMLERFLFPSSLHYTPIEKLSGGEKRRLYLLNILMQNPNFLILDEPTNDLDITTLSVLEDFLTTFGGVTVIVSHDRYFMDRCTQHLLAFEENGIRGYAGSCSEYLKDNKESEKKKEKRVQTAVPKIKEKKKKSGLTFTERHELGNLEKEIESLEEQKADIEAKLSSGETDVAKLADWGKEYDFLSSTLEEKMNRWEQLMAKEMEE